MSQSLQTAPMMPNLYHAAARAAGKARIMQVLPLVLVFYSFLLFSPEVEITVFGVRLSSFRIVLLVVSVPALWSAIKQRRGGLPFMDVAIIAIGFWMMLSFMTIYGIESGFVRGCGILIDTVLPYFVTRVAIRSFDDLRYFLLLCLPGLAVAGAFLALESVTGRLYVRPAFISIFGSLESYSAGESAGVLDLTPETRLGLVRAFGAFPHPILAGVMMIGLLPLYYFSGFRSWALVLGILVPLTGFFGLSSAAFLALILAFGAIAIYHCKAYVPNVSWWTISGLFIMLIWALHMVSKNGIVPVIARLTLTPHTAEYRMHIWEWGWINIGKNPWFGLGYQQWERSSWMGESVDAHFLLLAMRHGVFVSVVLLAAIFYGMIRLGLIIPHLGPKDRAFAIGINISVVIFFVVGQTVNYFGSANVLFMAVIGILASAVSFGNLTMQISKRQRLMQHKLQLVSKPI